MSRNFSLNGIGRRPTSLLLDDVAESGAGGKVCAIDCVRLGRFGRFVAVDDGMHVVARSGRFLWPATETTAPQSESAQFRLETLCHELRRGGWEQRATGSGRAWYAHRFLPSAVPARPGARENEALGRAPDLDGGHEEGTEEPVPNGHRAEPTADDVLGRMPPEQADVTPRDVQAGETPADVPLAGAAATAKSSVEERAGTESADGPEPERPTPAKPWYRAPRATQTPLAGNSVSNLCDRVTAYTTSAHQL